MGALLLAGLLAFMIGAIPAPVAGQGAARSPWPTYRGDLVRSGRSNFNGPSTNRIKWIFSTGRSGEQGGVETDPVIGPDGTVYIGGNNGILYGLDPQTGHIRWAFVTEFDTYAIYSTPFIDKQGVLYFGAKDGKVYALKPPRRGIGGEIIWSLDLGTTIQTSPAFAPDGTVIIGADDWAYYGITPPRGRDGPKIKWRFQTQGTLITSPSVDSKGTVYVASMDGKIYALEPPTEPGRPVKVRWSFSSGARDAEGGFENSVAIDERERLVYTGGNNGIFYALDADTGKVRWTFDGPARAGYKTYAIFSSAALGSSRTVYFGGKDGVLYALRERAGFFRVGAEILWRYRLGPGIQSSPLLATDGTVYLGDEKGTLHAVRPGKSTEGAAALWKFGTKGTLISSPAIGSDGTLYVGSMDGKLYAFNDKGEEPSASADPFSGTWYGDYKSPLFSGKVRAVAVPKGSKILVTWFLDGVGRGDAEIDIRNDRLSVALPIDTARCKGTLKGDGRLAGGELRGEIEISGCTGRPVKGELRLSRR